jgi:hypothetical protein
VLGFEGFDPHKFRFTKEVPFTTNFRVSGAGAWRPETLGVVARKPLPSGAKGAHAVAPIAASAGRLKLAHRDHGIDRPGPILSGAATVLNPDRTDLDLQAVLFEDNAVVVVGPRVNDLAEIDPSWWSEASYMAGTPTAAPSAGVRMVRARAWPNAT